MYLHGVSDAGKIDSYLSLAWLGTHGLNDELVIGMDVEN